MQKLRMNWGHAATMLVFLGTLGLAINAGVYAWRFTTPDVPISDEWLLLAEWNKSNSTAEWLLQPLFGHRYPVGKAVWLGLLQLSGFNFRVCTLATVVLLTATAYLLLLTLRRWRGSTRVADIIIPVLMLHLGHSFNLTMGFQVTFALWCYAMAGWLWCAVATQQNPRWYWSLGQAVYAIVMLLSGGFGIISAVALTLWCMWQACVSRGTQQKWNSLAMLLVASAFILLWLTKPEAPTFRSSDKPIGVGALLYLATGLGDWFVPHPDWISWLTDLMMLFLVLCGMFMILQIRTHRVSHPITVPILTILILATITTMVRGVGVGTRFVSPSAVGLSSLVMLCLANLRLWLIGETTVLVLAGLLLWLNHEPAQRFGYQIRSTARELRQDIEEGMPPIFLQGKYEGTQIMAIGGLSDNVLSLRSVAPLRLAKLPENPKYSSQCATVLPTVFDMSAGSRNWGKTLYQAPITPVIGMEMHISTHTAPGWQRIAVEWTDADTGQPHRVETFTPAQPIVTVLRVPMTGRPTEVRLVPISHVGGFKIHTASWMFPDVR